MAILPFGSVIPSSAGGKRDGFSSPSGGGQGGGLHLDHLLVAHPPPARPVDLVEAHVLPPGRRVEPHRDGDQAETNRARPDRPRHLLIMASRRRIAARPRSARSTPSGNPPPATPADR